MEYIKKQFVTYEIAKNLKEFGFDGECFGYFISNGTFHVGRESNVDILASLTKNTYIKAPLWQDVIDWFITKGIYIEFMIDGWFDDNCVSEENIGYRAFIWEIGKPRPDDDCGMANLHKIREIAILDAIEIYKNKINNK